MTSEALKGFLARLPGMMTEAEPAFAIDAPRAVSLLCSDQGDVLLQLFDTDPSSIGYGREWILMHQHLAGERRIMMPKGFQPLRVRGDTLVGVLTDGNGFETIALVTVPPPTG